jgi:hypothetical protein
MTDIHNIIVNYCDGDLDFYKKLQTKVFEDVTDLVADPMFAGQCSLHTYHIMIDGLSNYGVERLKKLKLYLDSKIEVMENEGKA